MVRVAMTRTSGNNIFFTKKCAGIATSLALLFALFINGYLDAGLNMSLRKGTEPMGSKGSAVSSDGPEKNTSADTKASKTEPHDAKKEAKKKSGGIFSKNQLVNCDKKDGDENRWSNRPHTKSSVQSLFNCDLPDSHCKYYYPANFFCDECGLGKEFSHYVEDAKAKKANGTLWNHMPAVGFPTLTMENVCFEVKGGLKIRPEDEKTAVSESVLTEIGMHIKEQEDGTQSRCLTERLSFLHVHKSGGSSLHGAFNSVSPNPHAKLVRHKFFTPSNNPGKVKENPYNERMENFTLSSLEGASKYPDEKFSPMQHVIFAVVRDPTERFISSIGQAMGASGSGGNKIGPVLKEACIKTTSKETLKCVAKYVRDHGYWIELHFTPQVVDIAFTTMFQDVPVALFPMKPHLKTILEYFGAGKIKQRDGSTTNYRSHPILTNMTVADYDEETSEIVCKLYEMDVRMQRSLGMKVPRCDPYIANDYDFDLE